MSAERRATLVAPRQLAVAATVTLAAITFATGGLLAAPRSTPPGEADAARAAHGRPTAGGSAGDATDEGLRIIDQRFAIAAGDEAQLRFAVDTRFDGDAIVEVIVHPRVDSVDELDRLAAGDAPRATSDSDVPAARLALSDVLDAAIDGEASDDSTDGEAPTAALTIRIDVDPDAGAGRDPAEPGEAGEPAISVASAGVYPLTVRIERRGARAAATTVVAVHDPADRAAPPVELAILAGVDDPGPWPSADAAAAADEALAEAMAIAAAVDAPMSWRLPPRLLEAVAGVLGIDDDGVATTFGGDDLLAVPAIALDPAAVAEVGADLFFTRQLVAGEAAAATAAPLATRGRSVWIATTPLTRSAATLLRSVGVQLVVVTPHAAGAMGIDAGAGAFTIATDGDLALTALIADPLGDRLAAAAVPDGATATTHAAFTAAAVHLTARTADGVPLALATADIGLPDADIAAAFTRFVDETPSLEAVGVSALVRPVGVAVANAPAPPIDLPTAAADELTARLEQIAPVRDNVAHVRSLVADPAVADALDAELDELLGTGVDDATADDRLAGTSAAVTELLGSIVGPEGFSFTLTGTSSELPLTVGNESAHDVEVVVRLRSSKLHPADYPVTIPAGESTTVRVPVTARSGGSFSVEVAVHTPDGFRLTEPVGGRVTVTRVTGLSQALTAGAIVALASWWLHHLRRRRTRGATAPTATE